MVKRTNASEWENKSNNCRVNTCMTNGTSVSVDYCARNNTRPLCYSSTCQEDGKCNTVSLYNKSVDECTVLECVDDGWKETEKNCTAEILEDPDTPESISEATINCYSVSCTEGKCIYPAKNECDVLASQENQCYEAAIEKGVWILRKRSNATVWEDLISECFVYECNIEKGPVFWSMCNSTSEETKMCEGGKCITVDNNEEADSVVIILENATTADLNLTEFRNTVEVVTGINTQDLTIRSEITEGGNVVRIVVIVGDESTAQIIADALKDNPSQDGILKYVKDVFITVKPRELSVSSAGRFQDTVILMAFFLALMLLA